MSAEWFREIGFSLHGTTVKQPVKTVMKLSLIAVHQEPGSVWEDLPEGLIMANQD